MNNIYRTFISTLLGTALCTCTTLAMAQQAIDETREMDPDGRVSIEVINGNVTITGWDRDEFHIEGELSEGAEGYELTVRNGDISFEEEYEGRGRTGNWFGRDNSNGNSRYTIFIPMTAELDFEGINTDLEISGLNTNTNAEVVNGEIIASELNGIIDLETVNGSIESMNLNGRVNIATVNGRIEDTNSVASRVNFDAVNGSIESNIQSPRISAEAVSGNITLSPGPVDELAASSVSGNINLQLSLNNMAELDLSTVSGVIDVALPADTSAEFNLSTAVGGRIRNGLTDDEPVRENRFVNSSELRFSMNGGNAEVKISTVSGNIELEAR